MEKEKVLDFPLRFAEGMQPLVGVLRVTNEAKPNTIEALNEQKPQKMLRSIPLDGWVGRGRK